MCTGGKCRVSTLTGVSLCVSAPRQTDATLAPSCVALSSATPDPLRAPSIGAATFTFCPQMVNVKPLNLVTQLCPQHPAMHGGSPLHCQHPCWSGWPVD